MTALAALVSTPTRFFDGGDDTDPPDPHAPPRFEFVRDFASGSERFELRRRIGYATRPSSDSGGHAFLVPADLRRWRTDFASVPAIFGWLVPRTGEHLPAALVHDALVDGPAAYLGPAVTRDEADRVFRDAMADLGTGVVRRWLVWTAVTLATMLLRRAGRADSWERPYYFAICLGTLSVIAIVGLVATANLFAPYHVPLTDLVWTWPWMRSDAGFVVMLAQGVAGAIAIPALLSLLWLRFWRAGLIAGVALAVLLHVTAAIAVLTLLYLALERLGRVARGRVLLGILIAVVLIASAYFVRIMLRS